jgi:tRNA(fMet)-specific endonuclease VapC
MNGRYLLDTNAVIALLKAEKPIQDLLAETEEVFLGITVLGELYFGAQKSERVKSNLAEIEEFAATCTVLDCTQETARQYGRVKRGLRQRGRPIPENDLWVAATALQYGLVLLTHDGHFDEVEGLSLARWDQS